MKFSIVISFLLLASFFSCSKEKKEPEPTIITTEQWEKFIGNYTVYDTIGTYLYKMSINHYSTNNVDSLTLQNFADTFNLGVGFNPASPGYENRFSFGIFDSIVDKNNKSWSLSSLSDDSGTPVIENKLFNDTLIFYFQQTNIQYYIPEAQPYFSCKCKHVAVKQ